MHANEPTGYSYRDGRPLARLVSIAYRVIRSSRKYSTRFYIGITNSTIDHFAVPSECVPSIQDRTHSDGRGSQSTNVTMNSETGSDYETSGHESTAFEPYEPEPQRFAEVHVTVGGAMQFVDDDQPGRWITSDTVVEVTR